MVYTICIIATLVVMNSTQKWRKAQKLSWKI